MKLSPCTQNRRLNLSMRAPRMNRSVAKPGINTGWHVLANRKKMITHLQRPHCTRKTLTAQHQDDQDSAPGRVHHADVLIQRDALDSRVMMINSRALKDPGNSPTDDISLTKAVSPLLVFQSTKTWSSAEVGGWNSGEIGRLYIGICPTISLFFYVFFGLYN